MRKTVSNFWWQSDAYRGSSMATENCFWGSGIKEICTAAELHLNCLTAVFRVVIVNHGYGCIFTLTICVQQNSGGSAGTALTVVMLQLYFLSRKHTFNMS